MQDAGTAMYDIEFSITYQLCLCLPAGWSRQRLKQLDLGPRFNLTVVTYRAIMQLLQSELHDIAYSQSMKVTRHWILQIR